MDKYKNKITAALIAFIGGSLGLHKLYLRDFGGFFLMTFINIITIAAFPWVTLFWGLADGLKLINMDQQKFDQKYNGGYVQRGDTRIERRRHEQMRRYETEDTQRPYYQSTQNRQPQKVRSNPFKSSGLAKYKEFDLDGAISDFQQGLEIDPNDVTLNYNIACAYSLSEKKDEAFTHLAKAVNLGFNDFERILTHDDLAFVRIQPEFDSFKQSGYRVYSSSKKQNSTNTVTSTSNASSSTSDEIVDENLLAQLNRLAELKNKGILSEEEFVIEKRKLTRNG